MAGRRLLGLVVALCLIGFAAEVGLAQASRDPARAAGSLEPYREGPLAAPASNPIPDLPSGAEELLGLSFLVALLYGFRASGLSRDAPR